MIDFKDQVLIVTGAGRGLAHLAEVSATDPFIVPSSIADEVVEICARRGITL